LLIFFLTGGIAFGQFKNTANEPLNLRSKIVTNPTSSFLLGFLNSKNLQMSHSFSMSYSSFGNQGIALGVYTNSLFYKFNEKLNFVLQTSIVNSPYSTFGRGVSNSLNGIYIRNAQLNYRPTKNTFISIQFSNDPTRYLDYNPYFRNGFYTPFFGEFDSETPATKK